MRNSCPASAKTYPAKVMWWKTSSSTSIEIETRHTAISIEQLSYSQTNLKAISLNLWLSMTTGQIIMILYRNFIKVIMILNEKKKLKISNQNCICQLCWFVFGNIFSSNCQHSMIIRANKQCGLQVCHWSKNVDVAQSKSSHIISALACVFCNLFPIFHYPFSPYLSQKRI